MRLRDKHRPYFSERELGFLIGLFLLFLLMPSHLCASQSTIVEVEGQACMGYDKSRKQTEEEALTSAKEKAVEYASTYIKSESRLKDFELEKELVEAYSNATVKVIQELSRTWYRDVSLGDCCQVKIKAEVIPDKEAMDRVPKGKGQADNPSVPINVELWTDKKEYTLPKGKGS